MKHDRRPLGRFKALVWLSLLLLDMSGAAVARVRDDPAPTLAPDPESATDAGAPALDPRSFDLILRTLERIRLELVAVEPGMDPDALRGRLLVEALWLTNNVTEAGLGEDQLLSLPRSLREDASRLVSLVLGDRPAPPDPDPDPDPGAAGREEPGEDEQVVPVRIRPYVALLESFLEARWQEHRASGADDPATELDSIALDALARTICPSNDPRDLSAGERAFAASMARRIASGGQGDASGPDLVDELDALAELLRRKNAELELSEGLLDVEARAIRLERFGLGRLGASIGDQDPPGSIPEGARHRVAALARLIARGVPFSPDPEAPGPPTGTVPDEPGGGGEPAVDPNALVLVAEWARLVDLGLIASGVDPANRRETLRRFSIEQLSCECRRRGAPVPAEVSREADRLADRILAEGPGPPGPPTNPVNVPVPVTTTLVPTAPSMPAVNPAFVLGPAPRHCWACPRSW